VAEELAELHRRGVMSQTSFTEYFLVLVVFLFMIGMVLLFVFSPWKSKARKEQKPSEVTAENSKQSRDQ
jgi:cytoskeletal protein RodZ